MRRTHRRVLVEVVEEYVMDVVVEDEEEILDMIQMLLWYQDKEEEEDTYYCKDKIPSGMVLGFVCVYTHIHTHIGHMFTLI